jgi:hypothetical protein
VAENAVGDLVTDPPAEATHDRTQERGTLIGTKTAIASTSRRTRMKSLTTMHLGVEAGREAGAGAQLAQFGARIASFRLHTQKRQGISAKTTLTKASMTLRWGRRWLRTARSTG